MQVIEPDLVGASRVGLGEQQDGGRDAGIGLESPGRQGDDPVELLVLNNHPAQLLVRFAGTKQHAVGHDDGGATARFEQTQEQGEKQQLGLLGLDQGQQVFGGVLVVQATGEGGIGEDEAVLFFVARVVLRERILLADVRVLDAVQRHVHAADAQHGVVEVVAVEHGMVEVPAGVGVAQDLRVFLTQIFPGSDQEATGAAGRVANHIPCGGRGEFHHQLDDVPRGAELAVLPGAGNLAQHVLVDVALCVPVVHGDVVEHVHHFGQQARRGNGEAGILHVVAVGRAIAAHGAQEGKDVFAHDGEHLGRCEVLEARPPQVVVGATPSVFARREDAVLHRELQDEGAAFFQGVGFVQAADEQQVSNLLHHLQGIGDAAGPEGVPDGVDLAAEFPGEHVRPCLSLFDAQW